MATREKIRRRRAKARRLRDQGESLRAIADRLGVSHGTVITDLRAEEPAAPVPNLQNPDGSPVAPPEPGNERALTHGCYSPNALAPRAAEITTTLTEALGPAYGPHLEAAVQVAALALARLEAASTWLDQHGLVDDDGELRPLTRVIQGFGAEARRSLEALALTPREWTKLGLDHARGQALIERFRAAEGAGERAAKRIEGEQ